MKIDNSRIEEVAVDTVNAYISEKTRKLSGKIEKADTGISVDGEIIFYSDTERKISTFGGTIPVQVKGKVVDSISAITSIFRRFDIETFRNFLKLDGVLIFVVEEVFKDGLIFEKQIFYKYLDVLKLIEIVSDLSQSGNTYKSVSFDKLTLETDFDEVVDKIRIIRRTMPVGLAIYKAFNERESQSKDSILQNFDEIVEGVTREIRDSDFYDESSEFLRQAIPQIEQYISQDFVFSFENAILLAASFIEDERYKLLQKSTCNKVLIFLAKLDNYRKEFDTAKSKLEEISDLDNKYQSYYSRELFISNINFLNRDEAIRTIEEINWDKDYQKDLYKLFYEVETRIISIEKLTNKGKLYKDNPDFLYLIGTGFSNNKMFLQASEKFSLIQGNINIQALKIIDYFRGVVDEILIFKDPDKINKLERYYNELKQYLDLLEEKKLSLSLGNDILNSILSIIEPQEFITMKMGTSDALDNTILQSLLILGSYQKIIDYLQVKEKKTDFTSLYFLFVALDKMGKHDLIIHEIEHIANNLCKPNEEIQLLLGDFLVESLVKLDAINRLNSIINENFNLSNFHYLRVYLFKIESNHNLTVKEIDHIGQISLSIRDEAEVRILCNFIYKYNDVEFVKEMWINLRELFSGLVFEAVCTNLLRSGDEDSLLYILEVVKWSEEIGIENEKLLMFELQAYYFLEQYKAILVRVNKEDNPNEQVLNLQLIAKINLKDDTEVENILEQGSVSQNIDFKLNAGLGLIVFGIDPVRGSKFLLRELIETNFQDIEIGKNYVMQSLDSLRNYDAEKELSKISGHRQYYYVLTSGKEKLEIITLPTEWECLKLENFKIIRSNSKEYRLLLTRNVGANVKIGKKTYRLSQKIPLSRFVYDKMLPFCVGDANSNGVIRSFTTDNDNFSEIVDFMKEENTQKTEILEKMKKYGFTGFVRYLCSEDELFNFFYSVYSDKDFVFNLGQIVPQEKNQKIQLSLSSLVFLQKYELGEILYVYTELYLDLDVSKRIVDIVNKEINQGYDVKKLYIIDSSPVISERNEKQYQEQLEYLDNLVDLTDKITNKNEAIFIHSNFKKYFSYDASSIQSAQDNSNLFVVEDRLIQTKYDGVSVLGMVHEYFMNICPNIERYINFLLKLQDDNNIYSLSIELKLEIAKAIKETEDEKLHKKYYDWIEKMININLATNIN
ncbi:TPA: hypothetical protein ACKPEE_001956 [Listeria monocytogenes]